MLWFTMRMSRMIILTAGIKILAWNRMIGSVIEYNLERLYQ